MLESVFIKPIGFVEEDIPKPGESYRIESLYEVVPTIRMKNREPL